MRGEIYMKRAEFEHFQRQGTRRARKRWSIPRNGAGQHPAADLKIAASRPLSFFAYGWARSGAGPAADAWACLMRWRRLVFRSVPSVRCFGAAGSPRRISTRMALRDRSCRSTSTASFTRSIRLELQAELGSFRANRAGPSRTSIRPKEASTEVLGIDIQVGRTGRADAGGASGPVFVGGVTVTNATLHNEDEHVRRKDVHIGDTVVVRAAAGDVIPEVVRVVPEKRPPRSWRPNSSMPANCPVWLGTGARRGRSRGALQRRTVLSGARKQALIHFAAAGDGYRRVGRQTRRTTGRQSYVRRPTSTTWA